MAKTTLSKLGLKPNTEIKTITWNDQTIEVKQYLPIKDKIELISDICNASTDDNHYINYVRVNIYAQVYTYLAYTNITVTDKQKEDIFKLYDMFAGGLGDTLQVTIPHAELDFINSNVVNIMEGIYKYQNSAMGIMEAISNDYSNLDLDATELQRKIGDPDNITLLKNIITKLG